MHEYETAKEKLDVICHYITNEIILRSETQWYEEGEKSTKYFLSSRKLSRYESSTEEIIDPKIIQSEIKSFFTNLYERPSEITDQECF